MLTSRSASRLSIRCAIGARHAKGTLAARVVDVPAGREVRTDAVKVAVTPGTWRLRLCAGPTTGSLRCALSKRVRTRRARVRLPATQGARALPERRPEGDGGAGRQACQRVRAQGSAASA